VKNVGVIGCGNISDIYLQNLSGVGSLRVVAVADQVRERAEAKARQYQLACLTPDELLADPDIFLVVNLTTPASHTSIARRALSAGKHVYGEKPLALTAEEAHALLQLARDRDRRVGSAPDTVLGAGIQTARKLIDDGWIGRPVAATAFMISHGPEGWHPDPAFYYQPGAGPLFDMGPYYLSALFQMLGPVARVSAIATQSFAERVIGSEPHRGERIAVHTPTHVSGSLEFVSGAVATLVHSFDIWHANLPCIEIYGSEGTLEVPDPNTFGGRVAIRRFDADRAMEVPLLFGWSENARGLGVRDLVAAIAEGRMARADGVIAAHVVEVMEALLNSARSGQHQNIASRPDRPLPMPMSGSTAAI